jgi:hypothetical protein
MKLNKDMIKAIRKTAEDTELEYNWGYIGVRVQEEPFELGGIDHLSHIWDNGDDTEEELDGICAIHIDHLEVAPEYFGEHVAIIVSDRATYGEDAGEIIMQGAEVAAIIC